MAKKKKDVNNNVTAKPPEGFIIVNAVEPWLQQQISENFADNKFFRIVMFYIIHSPCKESSYSRVDLEKYGWKNPWHYDAFKAEFDKIAGFVDEENYFYVESQKNFEQKWNSVGIQSDFYNMDREFVIFSCAGESNPRLDLIHHIRNALSHGRFTAKYIKDEKDYYIVMEDVNDSGGFYKVNARMVLKKSTLTKWIDLFECKTDDSKKLSQSLSKKLKKTVSK